MRSIRILAFVALFLPLAVTAAQARRPARQPATVRPAVRQNPYAALDTAIIRIGRHWDVPGYAVTVVKGDSIVLQKGYGSRAEGDTGHVSPRTMFAIGSLTKGFTAAALAALVEDGRLAWDDRVADRLPGFRVADDYVSRELTVRDLLAHRTGVDGGVLLQYRPDFDRAELVRRMRGLGQASGFRERFAYNTLMYAVAGAIIPAETDSSWDVFLRARILDPLGMASTTTSGPPDTGDVAAPHIEVATGMKTIPWRDIDNRAPAGGMWSNARDMSQWLRFLLAEGRRSGRQVLDSALVRELFSPQVTVPHTERTDLVFPGSTFISYGLGWYVRDLNGEIVVEHSGNVDGMSAYIALIPARRIGICILANADRSLLVHALRDRIIDVLRGARDRDIASRYRQAEVRERKRAEVSERTARDTRLNRAWRTLPIERYPGTYVNEALGEAVVERTESGLHLQYGPVLVGNLVHWQFDTFETVWDDALIRPGLATFAVGFDERVSSLAFGGITFARHGRPATPAPLQTDVPKAPRDGTAPQ